MTIDRRSFIKLGLGGFLLPIVGCGRTVSLAEEHAFVFGTMVDVGVTAAPPAHARAAMRTVIERFHWMNREWHAWKPGALVELNKAFARSEPIRTDASIIDLIQGSTKLWRSSQGLFDPAIGALVSLWGFHGDQLPTGAPPAVDRVRSLLARRPAMDDIDIHGAVVSSRNPAVQLDFGGYAKGVALDWALDSLAAAGCRDAIVNLGGNLAAMGSRGDQPWSIGVRHPQGAGVIAAIETQGREAVVTSGTYERYREHEGVRYPHIIDPRTGQPARHVASATVIHRDAGLADAAAKALLLAGLRNWPDIARGMDVPEAMLIDDEGNAQLTGAMARRVRFLEPAPRSVSVSDSI